MTTKGINLNVMRDDSAPHQIRLVFQKHPTSGTQEVAVSCTCLGSKPPRGGMVRYEPIAITENVQQSWAHYNNPANHDLTRGGFHGSATPAHPAHPSAVQ